MGRTRGGSGAKNGRDSNPKSLGIKKYAGETVTAGSIILKQRGTKFYPGNNVMKAGDDSLFATADGVVVFEQPAKDRPNRKRINKDKKIVSVEAVK